MVRQAHHERISVANTTARPEPVEGRGSSAQVVVVTGASAGLGRAIALAFARRGARIGLIARGRERLDDACREAEAAGGKALALPGDVVDPEAMEAACADTEEAFGPIDVWVNNAMVTVLAPVEQTTPEEFRQVTEVTYLGFVHGTLAALRRMRARDRGCIVQVGSALSYRSIPLQSAYCGAKHAMAGFTDSLRAELIHEKSRVRVTVVHMPALNTPQFGWARNRMPRKAQPVPPIHQPEIGAEAVYWASQRSERDVLVGWPSVQALWGQRVAPGLLDRYLAQTAWEGQLHNGPDEADRPDNLYGPAPGPSSAHGAFDQRAQKSAPPFWLTTHVGAIALAGAGVLAAAGTLLRRR